MSNDEMIADEPAFPVHDFSQFQYAGLSMRDYFATNLPLEFGDFKPALAEKLGLPMPVGEGDFAILKWAADVRSALRYLEADAMMKARSAQP